MTALFRASHSIDFWLLTLSFAICGLSTNGLINTHLIAYCADRGIPEVGGAGVLASLGVFSLIGSAGSGRLCDRCNPRVLLFWCRVGRGGAYRPASARSLKRLVQFSRKPLSYVGRTDWRRLVRIPGTRRISRTSPKSAMRRADGYRRQALFLHRLLTKDHSRRSIHPSSR